MVIIDLIYPKKCLECGRPGKYICGWCLRKVPKNYTTDHFKGKFKKEIYLWHYTGVVRKAILALKYKFARQVSQELAERTVVELKRRKIVFPKDSVLIPVPTSIQRKNWRGFNQTELIGKLIAKKMKIEFSSNYIVKKINTKPQTELSKKQRMVNLQKAFGISDNNLGEILLGKIILFDDIVTSGSTVLNVQKALQKKGSSKICFLTLARI